MSQTTRIDAPVRRRLRRRALLGLCSSVSALALALWAACDSGSDPGGPGPVNNGCEHVDDARGVELEAAGMQLYRQHATQITGDLGVESGARVAGIHARFLDASGDTIYIANDCTINELRFEVGDANVAAIERPDPGLRWRFDVVGVNPGTTTLRVLLWHDGHSHFRSEGIPVTVTAP